MVVWINTRNNCNVCGIYKLVGEITMNLDVNANGIKVNSKYCWLCKTNENITNHHGIPQNLEPKMNVEIPLCRLCHDKLHGQDMNGLVSLAWKISKILDGGVKRIGALKSLLHHKKKKENEINIGDYIKIKNERPKRYNQ